MRIIDHKKEFEEYEKYRAEKFASMNDEQKIAEYDRMSSINDSIYADVISRGGHINKSPNAPVIETDADKIKFMNKLYTDDHRVHMEDPVVSEVPDSYREDIKNSLGHDISDEYWESIKAILSRIPDPEDK